MGHRGHDCMVVDLQLPVQSVPNTTKVLYSNNKALCDKVCQWLTAGRWFSSGTPVSSTNKADAIYNWSIVESGVKHHSPNNMQSVPITTNIVSLNPTQARCVRYNIS
jgi:hypothetical protein